VDLDLVHDEDFAEGEGGNYRPEDGDGGAEDGDFDFEGAEDEDWRRIPGYVEDGEGTGFVGGEGGEADYAEESYAFGELVLCALVEGM
jgi:hypothetical protein